RLLHTSQDEVKKLAEDKKVRAFRDRGTLRFRAQDIDELARSLGLGSDPDLPLGEVPAPKKGGTPTPRKAPQKDDVFEFDLGLDDSVEIGQELSSGPGGSKPGSKPGSGSKIGGKSGSGRHR